MEQLSVLEDEGVSLRHVYLGHCNEFVDLDYLFAILEKGAWVGVDRFPGRNAPDWRERVRTAKRLIDAGFPGQVMLSNDYIVPRSYASREQQEESRRVNPDGYCFVTRRVLPYLRDLGVAEATINSIMVDNPRRFFGGE